MLSGARLECGEAAKMAGRFARAYMRAGRKPVQRQRRYAYTMGGFTPDPAGGS